MSINKLNIENDLEEIVNLPSPEKSELSKLRGSELYKVAQTFKEHWIALVSDQNRLADKTAFLRRESDETKLEGESLWKQLVLVTGAYYDFAIRRLIGTERPKDKLIPGLHLQTQDVFLRTLKELPKDQPPTLSTATMMFAVSYFTCLQASYFFKGFKKAPFTIPPLSEMEKIAHSSLSSMHKETTLFPPGSMRILGDRLFGSSLSFLTQIYEEHSQSWNKSHAVGPFSLIRLPELALLAKREKSVLAKYGTKHVEKIFEHQLALIAQSLGFIVIRTRTGQRTIDLVCISPGTPAHLTFLIEAKTSSHPYNLPAKDGRALLDYIKDVKRTLIDLPPFRFVLLIGDTASKSLEVKLKKLENEAGVPIRFCAAQEIANFRESLIGPIQFIHEFSERVIAASHIMGKEVFVEVVKVHTNIHAAYKQFVEVLLLPDSHKTKSNEWTDTAKAEK